MTGEAVAAIVFLVAVPVVVTVARFLANAAAPEVGPSPKRPPTLWVVLTGTPLAIHIEDVEKLLGDVDVSWALTRLQVHEGDRWVEYRSPLRSDRWYRKGSPEPRNFTASLRQGKKALEGQEKQRRREEARARAKAENAAISAELWAEESE